MNNTDEIHERRTTTHEQLQREVDYARAQQMLKALLESGLISLSEFDKISELNRKFFSPCLPTYCRKPVDIIRC